MKTDKTVVEVLFKSGASVRFRCDNFKVTTCEGALTGYEYKGVPSDEQVLFLNIPDIDCVRVVPESVD